MNGGGELSEAEQPAASAEPEPGTLTRINAVSLTTYSGPLPHPEILQQYEHIYPGAAKSIFDDFLQESAHRRQLERKVVGADAFGKISGAVSSALIGLLGVSGGLWLLHEGRSLAGLGSVLATLASLLSVYLYQQRRTDAEEEQKSSASRPPSKPY